MLGPVLEQERTLEINLSTSENCHARLLGTFFTSLPIIHVMIRSGWA